MFVFFLLQNTTHFGKPQVISEGGGGGRSPCTPLHPLREQSITGTLATRNEGSLRRIDPALLILVDGTDYELEEGGSRIQSEQADGEHCTERP